MRDILLVHPNEKLLNLYHNRLAREFRVQRAVDGIAAIRSIRRSPPQMLITEYDLPWMSGVGVLKFVRGHLPTAAIPVIFISHKQPDLRALNHGANEWIRYSDSTIDELMQKVIYHLITNKVIS